MIWQRGNATISDDSAAVDASALLRLLDNTYWAANRPHDRTLAAIASSICFSLRVADRFVGFGRILTDGAVYAVLLDVVIDPAHQRLGLGRWLVETMLAHPRVNGLRVVLWTTDQEAFYQGCGLRWERDFRVFGTTPVWSGPA